MLTFGAVGALSPAGIAPPAPVPHAIMAAAVTLFTVLPPSGWPR
ncbi:hypothetical protein [Allonocardiopsis opalescens]|nr:hypothetical protein [Allonocardiopsis opalescens]